jgi:hypothetical protein
MLRLRRSLLYDQLYDVSTTLTDSEGMYDVCVWVKGATNLSEHSAVPTPARFLTAVRRCNPREVDGLESLDPCL